MNERHQLYRDAVVSIMDTLREANVPDSLHELAFLRGLDVILGAPSAAPQSSGAPFDSAMPEVVGTVAAASLPAAQSTSALMAVADRLRLSVDVVEDVFAESGDGIEIIVSPSRLAKQHAAATKELAILVAVARQASGSEEWTAMSEMRAVCSDFNKLDSSNFSSTIREMDDVFSMRSPSPRKRELKLHRVGWERAAETVASLALDSAA